MIYNLINKVKMFA